ncbi:lytic polysaccharide monooxygenase, partial [Aaosphaeria arxii CBS 175.79]
AAHGGGSCQISLSYDSGHTWAVIQSWEGNCPRVRKGQEGEITNTYDANQDYTFRVPEGLPSSERVIAAWTWLNAFGNREFYMSCSPIRIKGG